MKFLCGSCRTKYQISDEKVRGKILTIRCKKCGSKVMVKESLQRQGGIAIAPIADEDALEVQHIESRSAAVGEARASAAPNPLASAFEVAMGSATDDMPTSIAPVPANQDDAGVEWYVAIDGTQHGPFAYADLVRRIKIKDVVGRHYIWHDGMDGWKRVRDVPEFAALVPQDKKKPPPPPPGEARAAERLAAESGEEGGKVVDFAQKRAERERKSGAESSEGQTTPAARTASDRVEQLDSVLNEALGIKNEGQTSQAAPKTASQALAGAAGIAAPTMKPPTDFSDGFGSPDGMPENLFDAVPRATQGELVSREATKFFIAASGVDSKKSRNKFGMMLGAGVVASISLFFILWATGTIAISIPGLGNPFAPIGNKPEFQLPSGELTEQELDEVRKALGEREVEKRVRSGIIRVKRRPGGNAGAGGEYVQDRAGNQNNGTRGDSDGTKRFDLGGAAGDPGGMAPPTAALPMDLPGGGPRIETPDGAPFDDRVVRARINEFGKKAVSDCYRRELMGNQNLRGKLEVLMTLQPSGEVSMARVEKGNFQGTALGECVAKRLKDLRFPSFAGETHQFVVPFVLEKGASY